MSSDLERLKQAAAKDPAALIKLADSLVAAGRADEAVQACRKGLMSRPDDVPLRLALGRALSASGELEEAQAVLLDAVSRQAPRGAAPARRAPAAPISPRAIEVEPEIELEVESQTQPTREWSPSNQLPEVSSQPLQPLPPPAEPAPRQRKPSDPGRRQESWPGNATTADRSRSSGRVPAMELPTNDAEPIDLERVAERLMGGAANANGTVDLSHWDNEMAPDAPPDENAIAWAKKRARAFVWLWVSLGLVSGGLTAGYIYRNAVRARELAELVAKADARVAEATYEGDLAARESYASAVRVEPKLRKYFAMVAFAAARLTADDGEDADAAAWAMLRRSEKEAARRKPEPDARADRELRQARALLALARGETCPPLLESEDGDIAARCASQQGDFDGARRILGKTIEKGGDAQNLRALLVLGSLELGAGDLDAADAAFRRVLQVSPQHPRAIVGRALVGRERGEVTPLAQPPGKLGPTTQAWFHLVQGLGESVEAKRDLALDLARKGIVHDGRLALLYGRARLQQGKVGEAEQAMRVAERLDPNDGDVAVLDAEVALAKGFEDKVAAELPRRARTPRLLAVLGRAQCMLGQYRDAQANLDAALARRPGDATAVTYRAIARAHLGDASGALKDLERAATQLHSSTPRYGLGLLAYERHDLLKARTELEKALENDSESFRARALLGRVLRDLGKPKEALAELERAARDAPALASVHSALGRLYVDLGRDREARVELRKVLDVKKATVDDRLAFAEATLNLGLVEDGDRAIADAVEAGALAGKVAQLKLLAQSWKGPKEAAVAAKLLEKDRSRGAAAHDARLAIAAGNAWRRAGDLKKAGDDLRAALYGDPLHANLGLGRLELMSTDPAVAESSFRAALSAWERGPYGVDDQTEARVGLARALLARKSPADAIAALTPALTDDPMAPEPRLWLARAYVDKGEPAKALVQAEKAAELDDRYADAFLLVGDLSKSVKKDKARQAYKKYLELQPDSPQAKTIKKNLASLK